MLVYDTVRLDARTPSASHEYELFKNFGVFGMSMHHCRSGYPGWPHRRGALPSDAVQPISNRHLPFES